MLQANWIKPLENMGEVCPLFQKQFTVSRPVASAVLRASARGVYTAMLNGQRIGNFVLAPGWTVYEKRIQVQEYDVTSLLQAGNTLQLQLAKGWYLGRISTAENSWNEVDHEMIAKRECAVIAELCITYADGAKEIIGTDTDWQVSESGLRFCDLYDGEIFDATFLPHFDRPVTIADHNDQSVLVPQQGEEIAEQERIKPLALLHTPNGETVLDFGQNLTGYMEITLHAHAGEVAEFSFGEILDKDGNFYNANYRTAKAQYHYTCKEGVQTHKPTHTFYGFRYVRIDRFPQSDISLGQFTAIVVHSRIRQTGRILTSDPMLNQLFRNIVWGQKSNYLDIPTDCPQRDARMGWTGDAQVFMRAASYNFDVRRFFHKWLEDMRLSQKASGAIPPVIPNVHNGATGAAWGDAVTICPWQLYLTYADTEILKLMFPAMKKWVDFITNTTTTPGLWTGAWQYGDWLELNAKFGEAKGQTRDDIVATAYYAHSTKLICKAGRVLGENISAYEALYARIAETFKRTFKDDFKTQTEYVLALYFELTDHKPLLAKRLAELVQAQGCKLQTGFVGTPYILHVLSENGYTELAYDLLLRREFPSWLYPITKGATTMWEHWDGIMPNGELWPVTMNSYNHYAYGAVADWLYGVCAGINTVESAPGFAAAVIRPQPTDKIHSFYAEIETRQGKIASGWRHEGGKIRYQITTPCLATAIINGKEHSLLPGCYVF